MKMTEKERDLGAFADYRMIVSDPSVAMKEQMQQLENTFSGMASKARVVLISLCRTLSRNNAKYHPFPLFENDNFKWEQMPNQLLGFSYIWRQEFSSA